MANDVFTIAAIQAHDNLREYMGAVLDAVRCGAHDVACDVVRHACDEVATIDNEGFGLSVANSIIESAVAWCFVEPHWVDSLLRAVVRELSTLADTWYNDPADTAAPFDRVAQALPVLQGLCALQALRAHIADETDA